MRSLETRNSFKFLNEESKMTKKELIQMMRLLAGIESVMVFKKEIPDYLLDELVEVIAVLEREILA